jgi:hypothetical protein
MPWTAQITAELRPGLGPARLHASHAARAAQTRDAAQPHVEAAWARTLEARDSARSLASTHSKKLYAQAHPHLAAARAYIAHALQRAQVLAGTRAC